ncbi:7-cyano-7-deazaguanine synthase [Nocardiopsis flavescens]|uniref:7-cyano-7-deazaguanine synthase n=1 Tax=Nocardiopsis flavescens TaxID=758803 RepID=UPI00366157A6
MAASGGLDSTVLAGDLAHNGHELVLLSFDYGQHHRRELHSARSLAHRLHAYHRVADLSSLETVHSGSALTDPDIEAPAGQYTAETLPTAVAPARNAIFLSVAISAAVSWGAQTVAFRAHSGDHQVYPDCRPAFVRAIQDLARTSTEGFGDVGILALYVPWSRTQIVGHRHTYTVTVELTVPSLAQSGFVIDFGGPALFADYLAAQLNHRLLNEALDLEPTSELLARSLGEWIIAHVELGLRPRLSAVTVSESPTSWAHWEVER